MTDFSPLDSALYESTPEKIAASLRYLRKADAVMAALMPLVASPSAPVCVCGEPTLGVVHRADGPCYLPERVAPADAWINLYRRAVDVANDLTNYVEYRPKLLGAERKLDAIENEARALIAANKENTND